jgi:hypothetical protein
MNVNKIIKSISKSVSLDEFDLPTAILELSAQADAYRKEWFGLEDKLKESEEYSKRYQLYSSAFGGVEFKTSLFRRAIQRMFMKSRQVRVQHRYHRIMFKLYYMFVIAGYIQQYNPDHSSFIRANWYHYFRPDYFSMADMNILATVVDDEQESHTEIAKKILNNKPRFESVIGDVK